MQAYKSPVVILTDRNVRDMAEALRPVQQAIGWDVLTGDRETKLAQLRERYEKFRDWTLKTYIPSVWPGLNLDDPTIQGQALDLLMFAGLQIAQAEF